MRPAGERLKKYEAKLGGFGPAGNTEGYMRTLPSRMKVESLIKSLKLPAAFEMYYLAYAEQLAKIKGKHSGDMAKDEAQIKLRGWVGRGLDGSVLGGIAEKMGIAGLSVPGLTLTFGNEHAGINVLPLSGNYIFGIRFYFPGPESKLIKMSWYMKTYALAVKFKCAIYNAPGNSPTTLIEETEEREFTDEALKWQDFSFPGNATIGEGWHYLLFWGNNSFLTKGDPGTNDRGVVAQAYDGWPDPVVGWIPGTNRDYSIYATCETV